MLAGPRRAIPHSRQHLAWPTCSPPVSKFSSSIPSSSTTSGAGLNLDSIDALELVVTLEREFGIKISNSEQSRTALASPAKLAAFIRAHADPSRFPP